LALAGLTVRLAAMTVGKSSLEERIGEQPFGSP
jgi:hypothetical protein